MAHKLIWVDDLDPEVEAARTVTFSFDGREYAIDLSEEHVADMESDFERWIEHARRTHGAEPTQQRKRQSHSAGIDEPVPQLGVEWWMTPHGADAGTKARFKNMRQQVRTWAKQNGWELGDKGRIPAEVYDQWVRQVYYKRKDAS